MQQKSKVKLKLLFGLTAAYIGVTLLLVLFAYRDISQQTHSVLSQVQVRTVLRQSFEKIVEAHQVVVDSARARRLDSLPTAASLLNEAVISLRPLDSVRSKSLLPERMFRLRHMLIAEAEDFLVDVNKMIKRKKIGVDKARSVDRLFRLYDSSSFYLDALDFETRAQVEHLESLFNRKIWLALGFIALSLILFCIFAWVAYLEISSRNILEKELRRAEASAAQASRLKSQFLATVSHEIRTPLNGILGMSGLIQDMSDVPEMRRFAGVIQGAGRSLLKIVSDLLDFSKIEAGKTELELHEVQFSRLIESCVELLSNKVHQKRIWMIANYDSACRNVFLADGSRLTQIMNNLLGNAIKFTDQGWIRIEARIEGNHRREFYFEVVDTGGGLPEGVQEVIFQPFVQMTGQHKSEGTGLGLSIAMRLVEQMGGTIGCASRPGEGSRFWFRIPARQVRADDIIQTEPSYKQLTIHAVPEIVADQLEQWAEEADLNVTRLRSEDPVVGPMPGEALLSGAKGGLPVNGGRTGYLRSVISPDRFRSWVSQEDSDITVPEPKVTALSSQAGARVLVVDDNTTNQLLAQAILESKGYRIEMAENGLECLEALEKSNFDVILLDCRMPVLDGYETAKRLRLKERLENISRTPIIALTANAHEEDRLRCLSCGMDDYIAKPFDREALLNTIEQWVLHRRTPEVELLLHLDGAVIRALDRQLGPGTMTAFIHSYSASLEELLTVMRQEQNRDTELKIAFQCHQLRASSSVVGATQFARLCAEVDDQVQAHLPLLTERRDQLRDEALAVRREIHEYAEERSDYQATRGLNGPPGVYGNA
jgi:signal transduction histidine kinase/CheY-like chemotaxis protein/HPt (histidine-containing phosphotransfer) domain-containing protein